MSFKNYVNSLEEFERELILAYEHLATLHYKTLHHIERSRHYKEIAFQKEEYFNLYIEHEKQVNACIARAFDAAEALQEIKKKITWQ